MVLNIAPSYRRALLQKLDESTRVDFFFCAGDTDMQITSLMDISSLSGFKHYLKSKFKGSKLIWQEGWFRLLFERYDGFILTGNPGIRSNWLLLILARLCGKKVYLWSHGLYGKEGFWQRKKNMLYMNFASGLFLYGNYGKAQLNKAGYSKKKMTVIYNSLDTASQKALRERVEDLSFLRNYFGGDAPIVIFLGRLTPQKSLHLLIEALGVLKAQDVMCNALIVGSGECEKQLRERAETIGVSDRIWFYGDCYDEDMIATLLKSSTVCVSPGNVGLTAMHALSYGVPVITHNRFSEQMPEFEAIHAGVSGDFFKYDDSISLADKIYNLITLLSDKTKKEACVKECRSIIDTTYNPDNQSSRIEKRILADFR